MAPALQSGRERRSRTMEMVVEEGFWVGNIDMTIFAEAPKIAPYRDDMRYAVAEAMKLNVSKINIKATTLEGLGAMGKGEGIGAVCVALLEES